MKNVFFIILLFALFGSSPDVFAETQRNIKYLPAKERNTIMNIVTKATALDLETNAARVQLVPQSFRRKNEWIFLLADIKSISGGPFDYTGTSWDVGAEAGVYPNNSVGALLKKKGLEWILLDISVNATDVAWDGWDKEYNAPAEIFEIVCDPCEIIYEIPYMWHGEWRSPASKSLLTVEKQHIIFGLCGDNPRKIQVFFKFGGMLLELQEGYCHYNGKSISHVLFKNKKDGKFAAEACPIEISFHESIKQLREGKSSYRNIYTKSDCPTSIPQ